MYVEYDSIRFLLLFFPFTAPAAFGGALVAHLDGVLAIFVLKIKFVSISIK